MSNADANVGSADRLSFTIFIAIALHAMIIFGISFKVDSGTKIAPTLNVTLATHDAKAPPEKADFLAQHNQQASGNVADVRELSTKQQADINDVVVRDVSPSPQQKAQQQQNSEKRIITTTEKSRHQVTLKSELNEEEIIEVLEGEDVETPLVDPEFASLQARLDQLKQEYARQPRIRRLISVSTKASYDAEYLHAWAQKIEMLGNKNFPEAALRNEIFGSLRLSVMILPNGAVEDIEILQSSGHVILDEAAMHIVKLASPFKPFPKEIRKDTDKLEIIRTWRFEITGLKTTR